jgi:hypothetical protein
VSARLARSGREVQWIDDPLHVDARGRTATTHEQDWLRDLVRAVLFTAPGERVHRPDFGSGVLQLVFQPASAEVATTVQFVIQGALQQWVGHLVEIGGVDVTGTSDSLRITVTWTDRRTGHTRSETFEAGGA